MRYLIIILVVTSISAFGQGVFYQLDQSAPNGTLRVCPLSTPNPCPSPASIFSDAALTQPVTQPVNIGPSGSFGFWVASGQYTIQIGQPYNLVYNVSLGGTSGSAGSVLLSPSGNQTVTSTFQLNSFDQSFASYRALATAFPAEMPGTIRPLYSFGTALTPTTAWFFNDRDGSDLVAGTLFVDSFVTNAVDRPNSQQSTALALQSRATGAGNYGLLASGTFNYQYNGSAILFQGIDAFFASPRNQGTGSIANTVGIHVANQNVTTGTAQTTAHGIEFESFNGTGSNSRSYVIYEGGGNNWLGGDNTWAHKVTLGCPASELVCTDTFANLGAEPNGTMKYCSDCTVATPASCTNVTNTAACTCAASGTGAIAKRINGVWLCN